MACVPTFKPGDKPADLAPFTYTPLGLSQHTRTLRLEPSINPKAPLRCSLQPVDLDTYPDYEALSYAWGTPEFTESLVVEHSGDLYRLKITPNLHHGLKRLRLAMTVRCLWVDAVCIDQSDDNDKAKQIPRMAQIYRQANNVIIWLGENAAAAGCLARLSKAVRRPHDELQLAEIREDCKGLYSLPWFRRRWIIQEAVLNDDATILCGDSSTSVTRMIHAFSKFEHEFPTIHKMAELRRGRIWNQLISNEILTLLESFAETECSNDLDRLYAIAGLSGDVELVLMRDQRQERLQTNIPIVLPVNYEQDAKSLYCSFAKALVKHYGAEDRSFFTKILVYASTRLQSPQHDGSWFSRWNMPIVRQPLQFPEDIFSQSPAFTDVLRGEDFHQIVTYEKHRVVANHGRDATQRERITDLSIPYPAGCTASELCTWIQSVFRDIMDWAGGAWELIRKFYKETVCLLLLFGIMTDWPSFIHAHYGSDELDLGQDFEVFKSICTGTKSFTELDLTRSPLREIARTMRGRRVVKWDFYLAEYSRVRGHGGAQNTRLAYADLDDPAHPLQNSQLVYPPTASFRIGIAPDIATINDELIVRLQEVLIPYRVINSSDRYFPGLSGGLNRGFVLRLSHEQCDYSHKGVPHYNLIGECAVVDDWDQPKWYQVQECHENRYSPMIDFDMCLH